MLYIVAGLPRTGKTFINRFFQTMGVVCFDTDQLRSAFNATPKSLLSFSTNAPIEKVTRAGTPFLRCMIEGEDRNEGDYLLSGEIISFQLIDEYIAKANVRAVFLGINDAQKHMEGLRKSPGFHDWTLKITDSELLQLLKGFQKRSLAAQTYWDGKKVFYADMSSDFEHSAYKVIEYLSDQTFDRTFINHALASYLDKGSVVIPRGRQ